jgi:hypothetical protein
MELRPVALVVVCLAALWSGWQDWAHRPYHPLDGSIAPDEPLQTVSDTTATVRYGRWTLQPRARYDITARVLGAERYRFDAMSDLAPEDLALGWGPMSDNRILADFDISQSARFFTWRPRRQLPIPRDIVISHSANTHVIPNDSRVRAELERLRVGQVVHLTGKLVDAVRDDGAFIHTSLVRTDTGAGACEVMLVETVLVQ